MPATASIAILRTSFTKGGLRGDTVPIQFNRTWSNDVNLPKTIISILYGHAPRVVVKTYASYKCINQYPPIKARVTVYWTVFKQLRPVADFLQSKKLILITYPFARREFTVRLSSISSSFPDIKTIP